MDAAMSYVKANGGLDTELDYQYQGVDGTCDKHKEGQYAATVSGHKDVPQNNPTQLAAAVANGPVSIAIEADKPAFQHYKTGVLDSAACGTKLDHGVLIVGYGSDSASGEDYWCVFLCFCATRNAPRCPVFSARSLALLLNLVTRRSPAIHAAVDIIQDRQELLGRHLG